MYKSSWESFYTCYDILEKYKLFALSVAYKARAKRETFLLYRIFLRNIMNYFRDNLLYNYMDGKIKVFLLAFQCAYIIC